jgi:anthranilate synthase
MFGVCLGLQAMVEQAGGRLATMDTPQHGKPALVTVEGGRLFDGLPSAFKAGRYHSIHAERRSLPNTLSVTALTEDGVVMALEHATQPWAAVQFHPESIMTAEGDVGLRLIENAVTLLVGDRA